MTTTAQVVYTGYREPDGYWVSAERHRELDEQRAETERMDHEWARAAAERELLNPMIGYWARCDALTLLGRRGE